MVSAVLSLIGLVGKQMGERVVPVGFTDSQQLLLGTYEKITVEELIEYSSNHPVGLLEMAKKVLLSVEPLFYNM